MNNENKKNDRFARRTGGFTVIEILVVISIIIILVAMVIAVGTAVKTNSQRTQTKVILQDMVAMLNSYQQETGAMPPNVNTLIGNAIAMPQFKKALNAMPPSALQVTPGSPPTYAILDGFGTAVQLVLTPTTWSSSQTYSAGTYVSSGGTYYLCILTSTNNAPPNATYWSAGSTALPTRYPFFQSAGPDGTLNTVDDIYSYDP